MWAHFQIDERELNVESPGHKRIHLKPLHEPAGNGQTVVLASSKSVGRRFNAYRVDDLDELNMVSKYKKSF